MKLSELEAMNNAQLLEHVRLASSDIRAADLLKQRWIDFWEKDAALLERQRNRIEELESGEVDAFGKPSDEEYWRLFDEVKSSRKIIEQLQNENDSLRRKIASIRDQYSNRSPDHVKLRDHVQVVPPFQINAFEEIGVIPKPTEVARMARVLSQ